MRAEAEMKGEATAGKPARAPDRSEGFWGFVAAVADNFRLALGTFAGNPLRSLLTLIGIVIGVATVVAAMALIEGMRVKVNRDLSFFGANVFEVARWPAVNIGRMDWRKYAARPHFSYGDLQAIREQPDIIAASAADYRGGQKISTERAETRSTVEVIGGTSMWAETSSVSVVRGRFFTEAEDVDGRGVVVLGPDVSDVLFSEQDPLGQEVRIRGRTLRVIGVLQRRGSFMGLVSMDNLVVIPFQTFGRLFGHVEMEDIAVQAADASVFRKAQDEIISLMRRRRGVPPNEENNFEISTNESNTKQLNEFSAIIAAAGFGICVLSLVVGGIGILNIMLVSVTERTREIGIRKALGARRRRVLMQFATEAVVLSLVGGVLGLLLGAGVSGLVRWVLALPTEVPPWAIALALAMSSGVGLVFGIYPAARAARLDPVEAMRSE